MTDQSATRPGEGEALPHPSWLLLAKMAMHLDKAGGMLLTRRDLATLRESPTVGRLMRVALEYGLGGQGTAPDLRLMPGAVVLPATLAGQGSATDGGASTPGDEIARLSAAATPGEWVSVQLGGAIEAHHNGQRRDVAFTVRGDDVFICALVNAYRRGDLIARTTTPPAQGGAGLDWPQVTDSAGDTFARPPAGWLGRELAEFAVPTTPPAQSRREAVARAHAEAVRHTDWWKLSTEQWLQIFEEYVPALLSASVLAPQAPQGGEPWQPIETAPKDATPVIISEFVGCEQLGRRWVVAPAYRDSPKRKRDPYLAAGCMRDDEFAQTYNPTHWMPFPAPPSAAPTPQQPPSSGPASGGES